jgi:hypothetical protein
MIGGYTAIGSIIMEPKWACPESVSGRSRQRHSGSSGIQPGESGSKLIIATMTSGYRRNHSSSARSLTGLTTGNSEDFLEFLFFIDTD